MKKSKKAVSVILTILMLLQTIAVAAAAAEVIPSAPQQTQISVPESGAGTGAFMYLSDFDRDELVKCKPGWGDYYCRDINLEGGKLTLIRQDENASNYNQSFDKGICVNASAELIYDLGEQFDEYDTFSSYIGVDASKASRGSVTFAFYLSNDASTWTEISYSDAGTVFRGNTVCGEVNLHINGYRYLRIVIGEYDNNGYDHAVLADARVYSDDYTPATTHALQTDGTDMDETYFENLLKGYLQDYTYEEIINNEIMELDVLRYTLVKAAGFDKLVTFLTSSTARDERNAMFIWLFNDVGNMRDFINGGSPANGNYISALKILTDLYSTYTADLSDSTPLRQSETAGLTRADLYERMMYCMSLVCAGGLQPWMWNVPYANPVNRYAYFKENYVNEKMRDEIFENLEVEEMRWVLGNNISDAEIVWLNDYARLHPRANNAYWTGFPGIYSPHHHISYKWYDYCKEEYYTEANRELYTEKYNLAGYEKYGLTYGLVNGEIVQRVWLVFEEGAVCGNISRTGGNLAAAFGVPACESGQPGHCAFLIMNKDSNGNFTWGIDNDISGWTGTSNGKRMPCDWGTYTNSWTSNGNRAVYILLSQAALDDYDNYCKAEEVLKLYDLCEDNAEREECLRAALGFQNFNLDAWVKLVQLYVGDTTKTPQQLADLAQMLCTSKMAFQPRPLTDLMELLLKRMETIKNGTTEATALEQAEAEYVRAKVLLQSAYYRAVNSTTADCSQPGTAKSIAQTYLNKGTEAFATFSFDGENAGQIVFNSSFTSVRFRLSFNYTNDGDNANDTWVSRHENAGEDGIVRYTLTKEELALINKDCGIVIHPEGLADTDENHFTIAIGQAGTVSTQYSASGIYANDKENRFLGNVSRMEYSTDGQIWTVLTNDIEFPGNTTVYVRYKASGCNLASETATAFTFTEDTIDETFSYISIRRQSLFGYSTQEASRNDYASYAIDGIPDTRWHTGWWTNDTQRYIAIKLDAPTYLSGITYTGPGTNGTFFDCEVYASVDGENWYLAGEAKNWGLDTNQKTLKFSSVAYGQYVKIVGVRTQNGYASAHSVELYEDTTFEGLNPVSVSMLSYPTKHTYIAGEKLDLTGMSAKCTFDNAATMTIPASMFTADADILETPGNLSVQLQYLDLDPISIPVTVSENTLTPTGITLNTDKVNKKYYIGEAADAAGLVVCATDGSTKWYPAADEYTVTPAEPFTTAGTQTVTVAYKGQTQTYTVTVYEQPTLTVTKQPAKTVYNLGDSFATDGMVVVLTEKDPNTNEVTENEVPFGSYSVDEGGFTATSGTEKSVGIYLTGHEQIRTSVGDLSVYDYIVYGNLRFEVEDDFCILNEYSGSGEEVLSVPECVTVNGKCYAVTKIAADAFKNAADLRQLTLPDTVTDCEDDALTGLTGLTVLTAPAAVINNNGDALVSLTALQKLTLTGETVQLQTGALTGSAALVSVQMPTAAAVTVAEDSLPAGVAGKLYVASSELATSLSETYKNGETEQYTFAVYSLTGAAFTVTAPAKTTYKLGETLDLTGMTATLTDADGFTETISADEYTVSHTTLDVFGDDITVTVSLKGTPLCDTFRIAVTSEAPVFKENLPNAGNFKTELRIHATVKAGTVTYRWYRSDDDTIDTDGDTLLGVTGLSFTPDTVGKYYVVAYQTDADGNTGASKRSRVTDITDTNGVINTRTGEYYPTLQQGFTAASSGAILMMTGSVDVTETITLTGNKTVTLTAPADSGYTVNRTGAFTGIVFDVTNATLILSGVTVDGGAVWTGTEDETLGRGTVNTGVSTVETIIALHQKSYLFLNDGTVMQNISTGSFGSIAYLDSADSGSIPWVTVNDATIRNCSSYHASFPGLIFIYKYGGITVNGGLFEGNEGACISTNSYTASAVTVDGGTFTHNKNTKNGGVIFIGGNSVLKIKGGTFAENRAANGGVICNHNGGSTEISGGTFTGNGASANGGVYFSNSGNSKLTVSGGTFTGNRAAADGGAIHINRQTSVTLSGTAVFDGNTAGANGGALYGSKDIVIDGAYFDNNTAGQEGDSIYIADTASAETLTVKASEKIGEIYFAELSTVTVRCSAMAVLGLADESGNYTFDPEKIVIKGNSGAFDIANVTYEHGDSSVVGPTDVIDEAVEAPCGGTGLTEGRHCAVCKAVFVEQQSVPGTAHTPAEPVQENVQSASCQSAGSCDEVVYCKNCGKELSRTAKIIEKTAHTPADPVQENVQSASCQTAGSYDEVIYCKDCGTEMSRTAKTIEKTAHTPGTVKTENSVNGTCSMDGGYDTVTYCSVCGQVASSVHTNTGRLPHTDGNTDGVCDVCGTRYCNCNCHKDGFLGFWWKLLCFFYKIFGSNPVCSCGRAHY